MTHKWVITMVLAVPGFLLSAGTVFSDDKSKDVDVLLYYNSGGYTVDYVQLFWEKDGVQKHKKWKGDLPIGDGFCADLSKVEGLEEGSEVWLKFKIAGGDKESCRKSQKMIFKNEVSVLQRYYSKGTTLNGNRCRNSDPPTGFYIGRGTGNCKYSDYDIY